MQSNKHVLGGMTARVATRQHYQYISVTASKPAKRELDDAWSVSVRTTRGKNLFKMMEAPDRGDLHGLWVIRYDSFLLTTGRMLYQFNAGTMAMRTPDVAVRVRIAGYLQRGHHFPLR